MTSAVALVTALAASEPDSAGFHSPSAERISFLNEQLAQARWVDVATDAGILMVNEPHAGADGLVYRRRSGGPPKRRAIFSTVREMPIPVQNPVPWSQIESVTWRRSGVAPGAIGGAIVGGLVFAGFTSLAVADDNDPDWLAISMVGAVMVGAAAGLGGLFGGLIESRQVLYRAPGSPASDALEPGSDLFAQRGHRAVLISPESASSDSLRFLPR